jgi:hypothetical protein
MSTRSHRPFHHPDYEYTTHEAPSVEAMAQVDVEMERGLWRRAWADVTARGVFAVYRRERV